jgi:hypothetical protein
MTKNALQALTVAAVSAASILLSSGVALADDQPTCAAGEEYQGELGCVHTQLPEEAIGGARCPDPGQVVVAVRADGSYVCGSAVDTVPVPSGVGQTPEGGSASARPQPAVPAPATAAPADDRGVRTPQARPTTAGTAPTAQPSRTVPVADQLTDLWAQLLDWIRMFLGGSI